jgi:hypothetical protein
LEQKAYLDELYQEALYIEKKFLETNMYEADKWTWLIVHEYMACMSQGWTYPNQRNKMSEAAIKYGKESPFWSELEKTKTERYSWSIRLAHAMRLTLKALDKGGLTRKIRKELNRFKKFALDFRRKLLRMPPTDKQKKVLFKIERILGIYYDDLSAEENGEKWQKEIAKELEE